MYSDFVNSMSLELIGEISVKNNYMLWQTKISILIDLQTKSGNKITVLRSMLIEYSIITADFAKSA